jgi:hypothetical protein
MPSLVNENKSERPVSHPSDVQNQANSAGNGVGMKPRVRARRGQATDPHSIAERLRREKISDRMKNLQDLVPNSNKVHFWFLFNLCHAFSDCNYNYSY